MKTLADFKRAMPLGAEVNLKYRYGKPVDEKRVVGKVQSNSMAFFKGENNKTLSWLDWPKATLLEFDGKVAKIYEPGFRDLNKQEQEVVNNEPRDKEQEYVDAISDGSTMYWRRKHYYKDSGFNYLFQGKEQGKRLTYQQSKKVIQDDSVKGNLVLVYEFGDSQ